MFWHCDLAFVLRQNHAVALLGLISSWRQSNLAKVSVMSDRRARPACDCRASIFLFLIWRDLMVVRD